MRKFLDALRSVIPAPADTYMMTAEEIRVRQVRRRRIRNLLLLLLLLLVLGLVFARPVRSSIKSWQARRHAEKAFVAIEQEKWQDARDQAIAAYQLQPSEPAAVRAVARFLSRTRQSEALEFWDQLGKIDKLNSDDLRDEASIALAAGESSRAEAAVQSLLQAPQPAAADYLLQAQLSIQHGAADETSSALDKVFADAKASEQQRFQAALIERSLAAGTIAVSDRLNHASSELQKLAQGQSEVALSALVVLAQQLITQPAGAPHPFALTSEEIRDKIDNHPLAKAPHKLLAIDLQLARAPERKAELIDRAIAQWKDADPPSLVALATWLNGKGEYEKTLAVVPIDKALQSRDLFLQHVDALGALGHWEDIRQLLEAERFPLDQTIAHMYLARCYAQLGQPTASENNWHRALEAAGSDAGRLVSLGEYAEKNAKIDIATSAYDAVVSAAPKLRTAWQGKLRIVQTSRDTRKIHDVLAGMLKIWPNDAAIENDEAYTRLLLMPSSNGGGTPAATEEVKSIVDLAEKLVRQNPRSLPHRTLLALALLKANRAPEALRVYENIQVAADALTSSALAIHAAVLTANGKQDDAKTEAKQVKIDNLLPEERELIEKLE
jgi:tetratricopeptide (TPR) repeat protein